MNTSEFLSWRRVIISIGVIFLLAVGEYFLYVSEASVYAHIFLVINSAGTFALLSSHREPVKNILWVYVYLAVFLIGYFFKTFLVLYYLNNDIPLEQLNPEWIEVNKPLVLRAYLEFSMHYFLFWMTVIGFSICSKDRLNKLDGYRAQFSSDPLRLLLFVSTISFTLYVVRDLLGIGQMGIEAVRLPFFIDTIIFRLQSAIIPSILMFCVFAFHKNGKNTLKNLAALIFILHYVGTAIAALSKSGLILGLTSLFLLFYMMGGISRSMKIALGIGAFLSVFFYQLGWTLRSAELTGTLNAMSFEEIISVTVVDVVTEPLNVLIAIANRITGADGIWFVLSDSMDTGLLDRLAQVQELGLRDYFTREIVGVKWAEDFREPGFVGSFILLGDSLGSLCLTLGLLIVCKFAWTWMQRSPIFSVLSAYSAMYLLVLLVGGTFLAGDFISYLLGMFTASYLSHYFFRKSDPSFSNRRYKEFR